MKTPPLPPHIAWPLFVVAILATGVSAAAVTFYLARSDGGAQVVEAYHEASTDWDAIAAAQAASDRLGWVATVQVGPAEASGLRPLEVEVRDEEGAPEADLRGTVRLERPHRAQAVAEVPLTPVTDRAGVYHVPAPIDAPGLWDLRVRAERGDELFLTKIRTEVR